MKTLVIYCHPNPQSFNHALKETAIAALRENGHEVRCRDLYELDLNPVLSASDFEAFQSGQVPADIATEQKEIAWADRLVFVYPIWWTGMPARMKGYIDRVFSYGFAYKYEEGLPVGLLGGKEVIIINTSGSPNESYQQMGMHDAIQKVIDTGIFQFCEMNVLDHIFFGAVPQVDDSVRKGYLEELKTRLMQ